MLACIGIVVIWRTWLSGTLPASWLRTYPKQGFRMRSDPSLSVQSCQPQEKALHTADVQGYLQDEMPWNCLVGNVP